MPAATHVDEASGGKTLTALQEACFLSLLPLWPQQATAAPHTARRLVTTAPAAGGPRPARPQSPRSSQLKPPDSHISKATGQATPATRKWLFMVIKTGKCPISSRSLSFQKSLLKSVVSPHNMTPQLGVGAELDGGSVGKGLAGFTGSLRPNTAASRSGAHALNALI